MTTRKKQAAPPGNGGFSLVSRARLLELYAALLQCRMLEERAGVLLARDGLPASRRLGCEASAVGVAIGLLPEDTLAVCHGSLSIHFMRGIPLRQLYASLRPAGACAGKARRAAGASQHLAAIQPAAASQTDKAHRVAVVFCGAPAWKDAAHASWRQAMRRAGAGSLPVVFVRHSDADAKNRDRQAEHSGFPSIVVDGNDVVAIYRVASEAIAHARRGNGPTLIDCRITRQRGEGMPSGRLAGDPVLNLENYLAQRGLFAAKLKAEIAARFKRRLRSAQGFFAPGAGPHK